jgi:hypothetical protein
MAYRSLNSAQIITTLERLTKRIDDRFPGAGLSAVAKEFLALGRFCAAEADELGKPHWPIRIAAVLLIVIVVALSVLLFARPWMDGTPVTFASIGDYLQALEAAINEVVFLGIAIWFLTSLEARQKRRRALAAIHQLRSIAHVVDMHQLTKDPHQLLIESSDEDLGPPTDRVMTQADLGRYLDYCGDMLSLSNKVAALFVQRSNDPQILAAVDEVSGLTNGLTSKIWQKLTILDAEMLARRGRVAGGL